MTDWPPPPLIDRFLYENYWPGLLILAVSGLMLLFYARNLRNRGLGIAGLVCLAGAAVFPVVANLVETGREVLVDRTIAVPTAFVPTLDEAALAGLLDENVSLNVGSAIGARVGRDALIEQSRRVKRQYDLSTVSIVAVAARVLGPGQAESYLHVSTTVSDPDRVFSGPLPTQWRFEWQKSGEVWRLTGVHWLKIRGNDPSTGLLP